MRKVVSLMVVAFVGLTSVGAFANRLAPAARAQAPVTKTRHMPGKAKIAKAAKKGTLPVANSKQPRKTKELI